jgi:uncharacterized membrane protein HdeD (DUF308 family)
MISIEPQQSHRASDGLRTALGIGGLIALVIGLLILFFPGKTGTLTTQIIAGIIAAYALIVGIVYIGTSIFNRSLKGGRRAWHIVLGLLYVIGGVIVMANLGGTAAVITVFLSVTIGILWLLEGIRAFAGVRQGRSKPWSVAYGIVSVIAGLALLFSPLLGAITLWLLLGLSMTVLGLVQVVRAFKLKGAEQ